MHKTAIIGSGISGIATAFFLKERNEKFDIIDSSENFGGRVGSLKMGNKWIDFGGKNIGHEYHLFREFVKKRNKDFNYEYFGVNTSKLINGKVIEINRERNLKSIINLFRLATPLDLAKMTYLIRRIKRNPSEGLLGSEFYEKLSEKYDSDPITKRFSSKFCKNIIRPMTIRMNASEPENYYIGNFGSNLKTAFDKYDQIREGMKSVLDDFHEEIEKSCDIKFLKNCKVIDLVLERNSVKGLKTIIDNQEKMLKYDRVIIATPAYITKEILKNSCPKLSNILSKIEYNPLAIMVAKYKKDVFNKRTRAMVFNKEYSLSNAGAYSINDLDTVRYTFSGKTFSNKFPAHLDKKDLIKEAESIMPNIFNIKNNKIEDSVLWHSKKALCSYSQYHPRNLRKIFQEASRIQGLYLTGDYIKGASIESCFQSAKSVINDILQK